MRGRARIGVVGVAVLAAACATREPSPRSRPPRPADVRARIETLLPASARQDRAGWAADVQVAFAALEIQPTDSNVCAVIAVTEQESTFQAQPTVPNLPKIARAEIDRRAARLHVPKLAVALALKIPSPDGRSYGERIDAARTERDLSDLFESFVESVPMGRTLFGGSNPVRTGGPMQVSIAFAERHAETHGYPYPVEGSIRREVFTRRGGMYFGIAHLLDYPTPSYDRKIYRFADFNAGQWASRNAAFQSAVTAASGIPLVLDGDVILHGREGAAKPGATELAVRALGKPIDADDAEIRSALEAGDGPDFERTRVYRRVFALAEEMEGKALPRARMPEIKLVGPKLSRDRTTRWFAERVEARYRRCLDEAARN